MLFEEFTQGRAAAPFSVGDPVIITGNVEYQGKTGDVRQVGRDGAFVVVDLYNYGPHSFHASDVSYNDYADSEDDLNEFALDDSNDPTEDYPCYDCGSTIFLHHTKSCDLAEPNAKRDLPEEPGTQYWTGQVPKGLAPIPGLAEGVAEGSGYDGSEPLDLSTDPSVNDVFKRALYIYDYEGYSNDMDYSEDDAIDQYVARKFGQDVLDQLNKARYQSYFGRADDRGLGGYRGDNLGRASAPGGNFRTTKAGKMHGQDAKIMKARVADRLGRHPQPNLPEQSVAEGYYDYNDYYDAHRAGEYGRPGLSWHGGGLTSGGGEPDPVKSTEPLPVGRPKKSKGITARLPSDPFGRTTGAIPKGKPGQTFSQGTPDERAADKKYAAENNDEKVGNMPADQFDSAMARLKQLAGAGPLKTVWDPQKRVYKNVPTAVQPKK